MEITNETQITGDVARAMRQRAGLSQHKFWDEVGITQSGGCRYETGRNEIPKAARIVFFLRYVAGIKFDVSTDAGAAEIMQLSAPARKVDEPNRQAIAQLAAATI